jgi:hypothetical protein
MTESSRKTAQRPAEQLPPDDGLSAALQILPLPPGLYLFSVSAGSPKTTPATGPLTLPAVYVGLGPGVPAEQVEFVEGPGSQGTWLFKKGDVLVAKVNGQGTTLLMGSVRAPGGDVLSIRVERLEARAEAVDLPPALPLPDNALPAPTATKNENEVLFAVSAHVRTRGDMTFTDTPWAGRVAPGLWLESFTVRPQSEFGPKDIEYKGLTGSGFETPWISNEQECGTKGMAVPLVGFAVRLKSGVSTAYDCEYSGYFASGAIVGPLRNGAPCRSTVANDPLEGLQVKLVRRAGAKRLPPRASVEPKRSAKPTRSAIPLPKKRPGRPPVNKAGKKAKSKTQRIAASRSNAVVGRTKRASSRRS